MLLSLACDQQASKQKQLIDYGLSLMSTSEDASFTDMGEENDLSSVDETQDSGISDETRTELLEIALNVTPAECLGPFMCRHGDGCVDGECGACFTQSDCLDGDVCIGGDPTTQSDGSCGPCSDTTPCDAEESCIEGVCLPNAIPLFSLSIASVDWRRLYSDRYNRDLQLPCSVRVGYMTNPLSDEEELGLSTAYRCQIKVHGGASRDLRKLSFRIKLDETLEEAWGTQQILLRAEFNDPTMMRNHLSHRLFERWTEAPVSRTRYVWLMVNGQAEGMYLQVERHTEEMLSRWGRDSTAPRFEADGRSNNIRLGTSALVPLPDLMTYWNGYELKGGASYEPLVLFIEEALSSLSARDWLESSSFSRLARQLNWGGYLRYISAMYFIQNYDHIRKNYLLTRQLDADAAPRWEVHPWDLDLSLGCLYQDDLGTVECGDLVWDVPLTLGQIPDGVPPTFPTDGFYNLLIERALTPAKAKTRFDEYLCELAQQPVSIVRIQDRIAALSIWLPSWLNADVSRRDEEMAVFQDKVEELNQFLLQRSDFIKEQLACPLR